MCSLDLSHYNQDNPGSQEGRKARVCTLITPHLLGPTATGPTQLAWARVLTAHRRGRASWAQRLPSRLRWATVGPTHQSTMIRMVRNPSSSQSFPNRCFQHLRGAGVALTRTGHNRTLGRVRPCRGGSSRLRKGTRTLPFQSVSCLRAVLQPHRSQLVSYPLARLPSMRYRLASWRRRTRHLHRYPHHLFLCLV